jgi:hypothetical protein
MSVIVYDDDAADEVREGMDFYDGRQPGLGLEFYREVAAVVARAARSPATFTRHRPSGRRKARPNRFPYTVYFEEIPNGIWIAAVRRDGQNDSWINRQPPTDPA